jgi:hypothetical protein
MLFIISLEIIVYIIKIDLTLGFIFPLEGGSLQLIEEEN